MQVVILDDWEHIYGENEDVARLKEHFDVKIFHDRPSRETLIERLQHADIIIPIRERTKFDKDILQRIPHVKLIAQTGSGLAHIDMNEANKYNISVATTPGGSSAVAELIFAFMLAYSRKLIKKHGELKSGIWTEEVGYGLEGKVIGIIGLGKIGSKVAQIANVFNMKVVAWGPRLTAERAAEQEVDYVTLEQLLRQSNYISINVRLVEDTKHLLKEPHFGLMKKNAFLINTSRGEVIDEQALIQALRDDQIGGAGLDVFTDEPLRPNHPFLELENVILSPHIGWKTDNMFKLFMKHAVNNILSYFLRDSPTNNESPAAQRFF
ncbi:D-2-hydroxyacid dehydrogenase family protein [Paenibacillus dendritiformis]|uniref:D-isomer specific 2-hydroxyacid dehydrogenase n=1 Tax=Paenibacillus dendritiformis C454 TaxID=1131935 RepID=H3SCN3_9BACL|nr:D-2-hydroxyacid dehydrogenase family protein [Paenibacillus dendritiformis]EHQ63136.1 D-isomer specific 2-hydroxyacid dehydrogenase [Paenibacillus dendritiformis C454]CAH8771901.1 D-2-hydroxyacid dehydrogenase family protein [Paenibacillus dendritiformis]